MTAESQPTAQRLAGRNVAPSETLAGCCLNLFVLSLFSLRLPIDEVHLSLIPDTNPMVKHLVFGRF